MSNDSARVRERHKSLYFTDGNVAILAPRQDGKSEVLFRVHKSVLSSHSPVFSDMFDVCNPSGSTSEGDSDQSYDGVPLVRLSDDADHLGSVLEILYYQRDLPYMPRSPDYPGLVGPILELVRKYGIDRMYGKIVRHFESDWPKTLEEWDEQERVIKVLMGRPDVERIDDHTPEPAAAIRLARKFDLHDVLPAAFYHLSRLSITDDWEKTHADTSVRIQNRTKRTARWELLSAEDFHCLLLGKAGLAEFLRKCVDAKDFRHAVIRQLTRPDGTTRWGAQSHHYFGEATRGEDARDIGECVRGEEACGIGEEAWKGVLDRCLLAADPLTFDPLAFLQMEAAKVRDCNTCTMALRDKMLAVRAQIWEQIVELFHVKAPQ